MFLPIGDTPNPEGFRAWVTWLLIAMNLAIYLLVTLPLSMLPADPSDPAYVQVMLRVAERLPKSVDPREVASLLTQWDLWVHTWGYKPGAAEVRDLFAAMFLHANLAHVLGNMLFLWIYGDNVEHRLGRLGMLLAYLGSGVAATLAFGLVAPDPGTPLVGASGAISGVLGMYFLLFSRNRVKVLVALFPFVMDVWLVPAPIVLGLYVVIDNVLPFVAGGAGGVAYGAHLGGFVAGLLIAAVVRGRHAPHEDPAVAHLQAGLALQARGQPSAAFQHLVEALRLARDEPTRTRAQEALRQLPLDPRLARQLGL